MLYFEMTLDATRCNDWFIGEPHCIDGLGDVNVWFFRQCRQWDQDRALTAKIERDGIHTNFFFSAFMIPCCTETVGELIKGFAPWDVQLVPISIEGSDERLVVLNVLKEIDCVDESKSKFDKFTAEDGRRPDKVGEYAVFEKLVIDPEIAGGNHIFRLKNWRIGLIVSETMRNALDAAGIFGVAYIPVTENS